MKDNKLDKFFREKAEGVEPEFDPKFWEQAERMLDAQPKEERRRKAAWWWLLPFLLISGCGLWWSGIFGENKNITPVKKETLLQEEKNNHQEKNLADTDFAGNKENDLETESLTAKKKEQQVVDSARKDLNSAKSKIKNDEKNNSVAEYTIVDTNQQTGFTSFENTVNPTDKTSYKTENSLPTNALKTTDTEKTQVTAPKTTPQKKDKKLPPPDLLPTLDINFLQSPLTEISDSLDIDTTQLKNLLKPKKLRFGWSIGAVVRREPFSDTTMNTLVALRAGLTLDYQLNKKWDLHFDLLGKREARVENVSINSDTLGSGVKYGFGVTNISHSYRLKAQYYLEGLALLRYKINTRHAIGAGLGAKYLMSVRADLVQQSLGVQFINEPALVETNQTVESGWWQKERTTDLLPFVQLRYDYRTTPNSLLFIKLNAEYNRGWLQTDSTPEQAKPALRLETSFGFNYQF